MLVNFVVIIKEILVLIVLLKKILCWRIGYYQFLNSIK